MYIDFKKSVWERVQIPKEIEYEVHEAINRGEIQSANDIVMLLENKSGLDVFDFEWENLDAEEYLIPEDNSGQATVEAYQGSGEEPFYTNKLK